MDVLLFQVHDQIFALDAETVREVVDPTAVTPLPFVPESVEGLVNISGRVIPQLSMALRLGIGRHLAAGEGTIVVLSVDDRLCACRVSKIIAKMTIEAEEISLCEGPESTSDQPPLILGEFCWHDRQVMLLDAVGLLFNQEIGTEAEMEGEGLLAEASEDVGQTASTLVDTFLCVLFASNNELFAFRFDDVVEVIERGPVTRLPGAPAEMVGVQLLRGFPLPLISMQSLLFGSREEDAPYVLVVDIQGCPVGLQVEKVLGIQRFLHGSLRPLLEEQSLLEGFITAEDNRLVGMIRFLALSAGGYLQTWRPFLVAKDLGKTLVDDRDDSVQRVLLFRQGMEMMAVPLAAVERVEEYVEPTETPGSGHDHLGGVIQVQGNVTPVFRLDTLTGAHGKAPTSYLILREGTKLVAVPVDKVDKVINLRKQDIDPVRTNQNNLLSGVGKYQGNLVSLISVEQLMPA